LHIPSADLPSVVVARGSNHDAHAAASPTWVTLDATGGNHQFI
jgi:hypothetical protein